MICLLTKQHSTTWSLPKILNLSLIKALDPAVNLEKMQKTGRCVELNQENAINEIQTRNLFRFFQGYIARKTK